jgi:membrane fusion protein (multidrug efflux system)
MNAPDIAPDNDGNGKRRRLLLMIIGLFALVGVAWLAYWLLVLAHHQSTDDAYVAGNQVGVSALTAGTVTEVLADETQRVRAGQVLVKLDRADNDVALQRAAGELAQGVRLFRQQQSLASSGDSQVASRRVELAQAEEQLARREPLLASHAVAAEEVQQASTAVEVARAALQAAERQAAASHTLVDGLTISSSPTVQQVRSAFLQAWLAARRTVVRAPISGYVARRNVQLGSRVAQGQALLNIIPLENLWIDANFKESQIGSLRIGQPATVVADVYGGKVQYHAHVAGFSAGTGAAFALLPAQNASGNWIKVVQRVPVRVVLDPKELAEHPLRIGLSTRIDVDTHDQSGPLLSPEAGASDATSTSVYAEDYQAAQGAADAVIRGETPPQP